MQKYRNKIGIRGLKMPDYNLFPNIVSGKNGKEIKRWYYWFYGQDGKQKKRACKGCINKAEAQQYIAALPPLNNSLQKTSLIKNITAEMFIPGSAHVERRKQLGKSVKPLLLTECRHYIELIALAFGQYDITLLEIADIYKYLLKLEKSGSWKNRFLEIFTEIYREASWNKIKVSVPVFERFTRDSKKSDILSTDEISLLFRKENFSHESFYCMFLLALSAGLRLGEAIGFKQQQILISYQAVVIDGFVNNHGIRLPYNKTGSEENPRYRVALVPEFTMCEINKYIDKNYIGADDFIFTISGNFIRRDFARREFCNALKKAGILNKDRKITPHSLRYTYVTRTRRLLDANTVQIMTGHSSIEMSDHYNRPELVENAKHLFPNRKEIDRFFD